MNLPSMPTTVQVKACCGLIVNEPCDCGGSHIYVYVICAGEKDEGADPVAVIATLPRALAWVIEQYEVTPRQQRPGVWMAPIAEPDEVWIHRMAVR